MIGRTPAEKLSMMPAARPNLKVYPSAHCAGSILNFQGSVKFESSRFGNILLELLHALPSDNDFALRSIQGFYCVIVPPCW